MTDKSDDKTDGGPLSWIGDLDQQLLARTMVTLAEKVATQADDGNTVKVELPAALVEFVEGFCEFCDENLTGEPFAFADPQEYMVHAAVLNAALLLAKTGRDLARVVHDGIEGRLREMALAVAERARADGVGFEVFQERLRMGVAAMGLDPDRVMVCTGEAMEQHCAGCDHDPQSCPLRARAKEMFANGDGGPVQVAMVSRDEEDTDDDAELPDVPTDRPAAS